MAVISTAVSSNLRLKMDGGLDEEGAAIQRTATFNSVKTTATDEQVYNTGTALAGLHKDPLTTMQKTLVYDLNEQA